MSVSELCDAFDAALGSLASSSSGERTSRIQAALLRAGELECVLADHDAPGAAVARELTDRLAEGLVGMPLPAALAAPPGLARGLPASVRLTPPEGFAYYALQPESVRRLAAGLTVASGAAAVVGIRSIGTTLSAVVTAALRQRGLVAARITVRPSGHPYDRIVHLDADALAWVVTARRRNAAWFVVDEGPGLSGSSLLAVGEALVRAGVDARRIVFLGTRAADPATLLARDAARRFAAFGGLSIAPPACPPEGAAVDISGGVWRALLSIPEAHWPATWPALERVKHLSADRLRLFKFEGLGRWGDAVRARAREIAEAGFGPPVEDAGSGFAAHPLLAGRPLARGERPQGLIDRLADYCAFRAATFPAPDAEENELRTMVRWNTEVELGSALDEPLPIEHPVIADARMHPHEWIRVQNGSLMKVDAAAHGDDHLFPGPVDVAWDLAGALVEWDLDPSARDALLNRYTQLSGDHGISRRLAPYTRAYLTSQIARAKMAAEATRGTMESQRLMAEYRMYRDRLNEALKGHAP